VGLNIGSSKIILLSGVYLILGFYTTSFQRVDENNFTSAIATSSKLQAEQYAQIGLSLALTTMANNSSMHSFSPRTFSTVGGIVTYSANRPAGFPLTQTQVVATGTYNSKHVTMTAVYHFYGGRWKILRIFTEASQ